MAESTKIRIMKIEDLMDMWEKDAPMDKSELIEENTRVSRLHAKYKNIMATHTLLLRKTEAIYKKERLWYWRFYMGKAIPQEQIDKRNPEISTSESILKSSIDAYLDGEEGLNQIWLTKAIHQEIVDYCKDVIKELYNRSFQLTNMREHEKLNAGK